MKKNNNTFFIYLFLFSLCAVNAQKIGYVDSKFLLENNPEYIQSKKYMKAELDKWNYQLDSLKNNFKKANQEFLHEKILLTNEQISKTEEELEQKKKKIFEFENQKFGTDGELINSQLTIINPIQNKIWSAVQTISKRKGLTIVLDKASESGMLLIYSDPRYDITPSVLSYIENIGKKKVKESKTILNKAKNIEIKGEEKLSTKKIKNEEDFNVNEEENDIFVSDSINIKETNLKANEKTDFNLKSKTNVNTEEQIQLPKKKIKTLSEKIKEIEKNKQLNNK